MVFGYTFQPSHVPIILTLILLEGVLAFDNAAVLAAMVRKLPEAQRSRALLYGISGAYAFRVGAILGVVWIIRYPILKLLGGAYLVYLAIKHLFFQPHEEHVEYSLLERLGVPQFWSVVISIELADLAFALDQVLVAVAFTEEIVLIIVASLFAIAVLRFSAHHMTRLMDWFPPLERLAYVAVGLVGVKLVTTDFAHRLGYSEFAVPKWLSIGVTLSLLVLPVIGKVVVDRVRQGSWPWQETDEAAP